MENRVGKQEDFDNFVARLKEYSKSDRPSKFLSWVVCFKGEGSWGDMGIWMKRFSREIKEEFYRGELMRAFTNCNYI